MIIKATFTNIFLIFALEKAIYVCLKLYRIYFKIELMENG